MKWWHSLSLLLFLPWQAAVAQLPEGEVHGYVYVEAFELRKEFAIRLRSFPDWTNGVPADGVLTKQDQAQILTQLTEILAVSSPLEIDNAALDLSLDLIRFVTVEPEFGVIQDERDEIPVQEAQVAAVFGAPLSGYPDEVSVHWNLFAEGNDQASLAFVSDGGKATFFVTKDSPSKTWLVQKKADAGVLLPLPEFQITPPSAPLQIPFFTILFGVLALVCGIAGRFAGEARKLAAGVCAAVFLVLSLTTWGLAGFTVREAALEPDPVNNEEAAELVHALLHNIYLSFDYRDESKIYDTLAASVHGDLLERIYLDVRKGLELEEQGGPRVKINQIDLRNCELASPDSGQTVRADAEWVAVGDVSHWGHLHTRLNKYHAWLTLEPMDDTWKLVELEIVEEGRL